jgi:cephalosporin hydroxylase
VRDDVKAFVELFARVVDPPAPVLEIGSLQTAGQEGYADLRPAFAGKAYIGCDLVAGPGVDRVADAEALGVADASIGTVVMADSLEHVADTRRALSEVYRVLAPDGVCLIAAPFIFPIHHQPDYVRFTPEGMATLLAAFPATRVFACGDAQWPHTVYAIARKRKSVDGDAFAHAVERLVEAWRADARYDPLVPFVPLTTVARLDTGDVRAETLEADRGPQRAFECSAAGLCRIDVKLEARGPRAGRDVRLTLTDAHAGRPLAEATVPVRAPAGPRWVAFQFPALAASAGRRLTFRLTSPTGAPDAHVAAQVAPDGGPTFEAFVRRAARAPADVAGGSRPFASGLDRPVVERVLHGTLGYTYRGIPMQKDPFDVALYSMLLWREKPRTIIEIGSRFGGSALWFADLLEVFGIDGRVHSIDVVPVDGVSHARVTFHTGDARALGATLTPGLLATLPRPWLVIEDSDHQYLTCRNVLEFFAARLRPGEYLVVEDGILEDLGRAAQYDGGPNRAIREFLAAHPGEYVIDTGMCDFFGPNFTFNTNGYLVKS